MELSVIIPAYNEAGNIRALLAELRTALDGRISYEVICVDDGSTDDTLNELLAARDNNFPGLRILQHRRNYGQSAAVMTGVKVAQAAWVATMDGDGQNDPADIPRLLELARAGKCNTYRRLIVGARRIRQDTRLKWLSSRVANAVRLRLLKDGVRDTGCGLKVFSRDAFLALPFFDHMHRFLPALFRASGGMIEVVEVNHRPRAHGCSNYGVHNRLWAGIIDLLGMWWLLRRSLQPEFTEVCGDGY